MNVLWITSVYPSAITPGAGVFHKTQVDSIRKLGINVDVISPVPYAPKILASIKKKYNTYREIPSEYELNGVSISRPSYLSLPGQLKWSQPDKRFAHAITSKIRKSGKTYDLIHAHFAMPSGGAAAILCKKLNIPYVLTLHGSDVNVYPHYSSSAMKGFIRSVRGATKVLTVSQPLAERTAELTGVNASVLPIGINQNTFEGGQTPTQQSIREKLNLPFDKVLLVFVGRLVKEKGIIELSEALKKLDDRFYGVFLGDGPLLTHLKEDNALSKKVKLVGQVSNEKVKDFLAASDIFILPSYNEGSPTVVIEALTVGVPVIATDVGGIPDLFGKHSNLLIKPESSEAIVNQVKAYADEGVFSKEISMYLQNKMTSEFDVDQNSKKLIGLYEQLI